MTISKQLEALEYAFDIIKQSELFKDIEKVILFGSYARGEQKNDSDIDLLIVLPEFVLEQCMTDIRKLREQASSNEPNAVEADIKFIAEKEWKSQSTTFLEEVRKDGIVVWEKH